MRPAIYILYFGDGKFEPLLKRIWAQYVKARMLIPAWVLTDTTTPVPENLPVVRVNASSYSDRFVRKGNAGQAFDYKSCLIMSLIEHVLRDSDVRPIILDCDNEIRSDFTGVVANVPPDKMAISPDPGERPIYHPYFSRMDGPVIEQSSSCMVFPVAEISRGLMALYRVFWSQTREADHTLLEQRTWTLINKASDGVLMPKTMAWSRHWGAEPADIKIRHPHGVEKWEGIAKWEDIER